MCGSLERVFSFEPRIVFTYSFYVSLRPNNAGDVVGFLRGECIPEGICLFLPRWAKGLFVFITALFFQISPFGLVLCSLNDNFKRRKNKFSFKDSLNGRRQKHKMCLELTC